MRLSGHGLEAFGFKEGAKFTAIGVVEGALLVLAVYEPASAVRSSRRGASSGSATADDPLPGSKKVRGHLRRAIARVNELHHMLST